MYLGGFMRISKKQTMPILVLLSTIICILCGIYGYKQYKLWRVLNAEPLLIGHAMGGLDGGRYSNSLEAFEANYAKGIRVFEADLQVTSDNIMVLRHDWTKDRGQEGLLKYEGYIPTYDEFMNTPLYGKFTPLSANDLFKLMKKYDDIFIVTDTKSGDSETVIRDFELLVKTAKEARATSCLDRVIVQIYNDEMYDTVNNIYPFKHWIYTVYKRGIKDFDQLCEFCIDRDIEIITMNQNKYTDELQAMVDQYDLKLFLHTVNKKKKAKNYYEKGVDGFYTDKLKSTSFE